MSPLAKDIFSIGLAGIPGVIFPTCHPTEHARATEEQLHEALKDIPPLRLSPEDIDRMGLDKETICEGRIAPPRPLNFHDL